MIELLDAILQLRHLSAQPADLLNELLHIGIIGQLVRHCPRACPLGSLQSAIPKPWKSSSLAEGIATSASRLSTERCLPRIAPLNELPFCNCFKAGR